MKQFIFGISITIIMASCATSKLAEQGQTAYDAGNYQEALNNYEQIIQSKESGGGMADTSIYYKAGVAAVETGNVSKARKYFETAEDMQYSAPRMFAELAKIYHSIDNLSLEIEALENYHNKFPEGEQIDTIRIRLFETYVESENWQKAVNLWPEVKSLADDNLQLLTGYLTVNKALENDQKCDELAAQILKKDPDNIAAMEWFAEKYFWKAENRYVREMKAYQNNRTNSQYKKLLKAWDVIWPDFRKSRDYYLKLYKKTEKPEYARFLYNIYKRMKKEKKAAYYKKRSK